ncbi:MAG: sugar ABC transporter substrate-binding protein [Clostridia bacterium]|nr:sugar ABC transporter substrate-binding protein [Clostridia bacterium]
MKKIFVMMLALVMVLASFGAIAAKDPYTDPIRVAWIATAATEANCTAWRIGIENEAAYWSNVTVDTYDGERDANKQVTLVNECIAQEYDGIIIQTYNKATLTPAIEDAISYGIPVVCINMDSEAVCGGLVSMTDYEAGYVIAQAINEALNGEGNVVVIQATPGAARGENLEAGFQAAMQQFPGLTILDEQTAEWNMEKANTVMSDFITKYGDTIDAVFAHNDQMAEGAGIACQTAGIDDIIIWGANGETKALEYIEEGIITGTVYTNCYDQGATALRLLMMYIGSDIDISSFSATPVIKMPPITVTLDNVDSITADMRW